MSGCKYPKSAPRKCSAFVYGCISEFILKRSITRNHVFEDLAINWLRQAGFDLYTETASGGQFGFAAVNGRLCGHVDGVLAGGPESIPRKCSAFVYGCISEFILKRSITRNA
jgi:hypothetical protein